MDYILPFQESKLRPNLKMAATRIGLMNSKKENAIKHAKREIAKLLELGKEEKARIRAEHMIREDFTMEALEIIQLLCELVHERCKHLVNEKECPADLLGAVATLLYSAKRVDVSELDIVHRQLIKKYGAKFAEDVTREDGGAVNPRVIEKLAVRPPSAEAVVEYLKKTAAEFNIEWTPTIVDIEDRSGALPAPVGFSVPMAPGTSYADVYRSTTATGGAAGEAQPPSYAQSQTHFTPAPVEYAQYVSPAPPAPGYVVATPVTPTNSSDFVGGVKPAGVPPPLPPAGGSAEALPLPPAPTATSSSTLGASSNAAAGPTYDDLAARFAALRKP